MGTEHTHKPTPDAAKSAPDHGRARPSPAIPATADPAALIALQRSAGNRAVVQRIGDSDEEKIAAALRSRDPADVKAIGNVSKATPPQRIQLLEILANQGWAGPRDEWKMEEIWGSFGESLPLVMEAHKQLWDLCIARGAELEDLPVVTRLKNQFARDVVALTTGYLDTNHGVVTREMTSFGISASGAPAQAPAPDQQQRLQHMQEAAKIVAEMQRAQQSLRRVQVGFDVDPNPQWPGMMPSHFDRYHPPQIPASGEPGTKPFAEVAAQYDAAQRVIRLLVGRYPSLYAVSRGGEAAASEAFGVASPQQAQAELGRQLVKLRDDIAGARQKITSGDLDPMDLRPIHDQLLGGKASASGTHWNGSLERFAAHEAVGDSERAEFWTRLGLESLAAAAFILAPFTGGASLLVMAVGVGATAVEAGMSAQRYDALAQAARTEVTPGSELVAPETEIQAKAQADADMVMLAISALLAAAGVIGAGVAAVRAASGGRSVQALAQAEAQRLIAMAAREEGAVTTTLQGVARGSGGRLAGLENVIKSEASLTRKIADNAATLVAGGMTPEAAVAKVGSGIKDALRYTMEVETSQYMATYRRTVQALEGQGCTKISSRNTWATPGSAEAGPYRGINESWRTPGGQVFELQFHTPESFLTKTQTHALYEELRAAGTSPARIEELKRQMTQISDKIPVPEGAVPSSGGGR